MLLFCLFSMAGIEPVRKSEDNMAGGRMGGFISEGAILLDMRISVGAGYGAGQCGIQQVTFRRILFCSVAERVGETQSCVQIQKIRQPDISANSECGGNKDTFIAALHIVPRIVVPG